MIKAEITGSAGKPLDQVLDRSGTVRFVRRPDVQPCFLRVMTKVDATVVVEVDGDPVATHKVKIGVTQIPLATLVPSRFSFFSLVPALGVLGGRGRGNKKPTKPSEPSEFTILVRKGDANGELIGTFKFRLVSEAAFDQQFDRVARDSENLYEAPKYTTDERSVDTAKNCWNCRKALEEGVCCDKCGCKQDETDEDDGDGEVVINTTK